MEADKKRKLACDSCKRKKLKCEWEEDSVCIRCNRNGTECVPQPTNQRKKREKKPNTYLSSLEDRLKRMEAAMMRSTNREGHTPGARRSSEDMGNQAIVDELSLLKINDDGSTVFVGSASGFSIFSPKGLQWITEKTGDKTFADIISTIPTTTDNAEALFNTKMWEPLSESEREPLPAREVAATYIEAYFRKVAALFPIHDQTSFCERFQRQYPVTPAVDVVWYANLNIICAMGCVIRDKCQPKTPSPGTSPRHPKAQDTVWWKWFRNATSCFMELQFREASLGAVQAMIGMSFLLQTLPDPDPCTVVSAVAMRLAQAIGLHRNLNAYGSLSQAAIDERRNTFWVGLLVERTVSFRLGLPSAIHEDDIGIDFPKANDQGLIPGHFRSMAKLGILQGRIYNKLYSAKSLTKSTLQRLQRVGILDEELQQWKESIPANFRPGNKIVVDSEVFSPEDIMPVLIMHFAYFNALTIIHRVSNHHGPWTRRPDDPFNLKAQESGLNPRVFAGGAICVNAARSVIELLSDCANAIDAGDLNMIRIVAYYPLTASLTLFANVLQNPWDPQALQDIQRMYSVTKFLTDFYNEFETNEARFILKTFSEVNRLASQFVTRSRTETQPPPKRNIEQFSPVLPEDQQTAAEHGWGDFHYPIDQSLIPIDPFTNTSLFDGIGPNSSNMANPRFGLPVSTVFDSQPRQSINSQSQPRESLDMQFQLPTEPFNTQFQDPLETPTNNLNLKNDPLASLDSSRSYKAESTPGTNCTSEQQTPEWMDTDEPLMPQDSSWFFPISNPWDIYYPNNNPGGQI